MLSKFLALVLFSIPFVKSFGQQNDFTGKVVYQLASEKNSRLHVADRMTCLFSDSSIAFTTADGSHFVDFLYSKSTQLTIGGEIKTVQMESNGYSLSAGLAPMDTMNILGYNCVKANSLYILVSPVESRTTYEYYISPLKYSVPESFTAFDIYYNNGFGRIPLNIKQTNIVNEKETVFEWIAVEVVPQK